ncbi:MAG: NOG1 family protein [Candidatus Heimdallarchaeaceae archaeon]
MNKVYQSGNPFKKVRYIPSTSSIIKNAFQKEKKTKSKFVKKRQSREEKIAALEKERIMILTEEMTKKIDSIVKQFPWIEDIHPFYRELCQLMGDIDKIKKILGRLQGISKQIKNMRKEQFEKLYQTNHPVEMAKIRREAEGRFVSLLKKAEGDIKYLTKTVKKLKAVPDFNLLLPTIVVAGAPNVGKSSLVKAISTGKPEIGEYPFTTKQVFFGHRDLGYIKVQIVDTPGLLDRPFQERNIIELQSIASIEYIADIIVFLFDASKDAAISLTEQNNLLGDILDKFHNVPLIKALNKIDMLSEREIKDTKKIINPEHLISTKNTKTLEPLICELEKRVKIILKKNYKFKDYFQFKIAEEFLPIEENSTIDYG